jgi:tellurite resistance protein
MAEWRKVAKAFALADGHISEKEVAVLRKEILADGAISKSEMDFLLEIKAEAKSAVKLLDELIAECQATIK